MTHFVNRATSAKSVADANNCRMWCGRELPATRGTYALTAVDCFKCREAFAKVLRALPNVDDRL